MCFSEETPLSLTTGLVGGEVKLSVSYRNGTLFIMVMHIKDLVSFDHFSNIYNMYVCVYVYIHTDLGWGGTAAN